MRTTPIPVQILPTASAASDQLSNSLLLQNIFAYSVQATFSGAAAGTISLEGSLDGTTFVQISGSSLPISDSGTTIWDVNGCGYQYVRCRWVHSGGSAGNITVTAFIKGF